MAQIAGAGHVRPEDLAQIRHDPGLDRPFVVQFADWLAGACTGRFWYVARQRPSGAR
ncbi:MAG: hypothetical protein U0531_08010 [Dehalococcoidia bacterium]